MGGNPGGRGGGSCPPPQFCRWGHNIKCSPPPHVFVVGRFFVEKIRILNKICWLFFFFFACQNVGVGPTGTPNLSLKNCQRPPPPRSSAFLGVARLWAGGASVRKTKIMSPPLSPSDFRPCPWGMSHWGMYILLRVNHFLKSTLNEDKATIKRR